MIEKFKCWFVDNINWCEGFYYDRFDHVGNPVAKPNNKIYNFFYKNWLWPWKQNDCMCCNTVRGVLYGLIVGATSGYIVGRFIC